MPYYSMREYTFVKFERAKAKNKKYNAIIRNKKTGREKRIPFGDKRYQHFRDSTGLGLYSSKNHGDVKRRANYRSRHQGKVKAGYYSAGYFALTKLW